MDWISSNSFAVCLSLCINARLHFFSLASYLEWLHRHAFSCRGWLAVDAENNTECLWNSMECLSMILSDVPCCRQRNNMKCLWKQHWEQDGVCLELKRFGNEDRFLISWEWCCWIDFFTYCLWISPGKSSSRHWSVCMWNWQEQLHCAAVYSATSMSFKFAGTARHIWRQIKAMTPTEGACEVQTARNRDCQRFGMPRLQSLPQSKRKGWLSHWFSRFERSGYIHLPPAFRIAMLGTAVMPDW